MIACGNVISLCEITGMHKCIPYGVNIPKQQFVCAIACKVLTETR